MSIKSRILSTGNSIGNIGKSETVEPKSARWLYPTTQKIVKIRYTMQSVVPVLLLMFPRISIFISNSLINEIPSFVIHYLDVTFSLYKSFNKQYQEIYHQGCSDNCEHS